MLARSSHTLSSGHAGIPEQADPNCGSDAGRAVVRAGECLSTLEVEERFRPIKTGSGLYEHQVCRWTSGVTKQLLTGSTPGAGSSMSTTTASARMFAGSAIA